MTRTEFVEEVLDFGDLINFCYENRCDDIVQSIYSRESVDDIIMEGIRDNCFGCDTWQQLYTALDTIPDCEWYDLEYDYDEADFDYKKEEVLNYADENGLWEEEEDEEDDDETFVLNEEDGEQEPDVNTNEMMLLFGCIL